MKKAILALGLLFSAFHASAVTHFIVAGEGEIMLSKDGERAGIYNSADKSALYFHVVHTERANNCDISIFQGDKDLKDMMTVSVCDKLKPMVKFGRYYDGNKQGGWLVDASRYMYFSGDEK